MIEFVFNPYFLLQRLPCAVATQQRGFVGWKDVEDAVRDTTSDWISYGFCTASMDDNTAGGRSSGELEAPVFSLAEHPNEVTQSTSFCRT